MHTDDFGFQDYIETSAVEVLPASFSSQPRSSFRANFRSFSWLPSSQSRLKWSCTVLLASSILFGCSVTLARSSDRLDQWRHHSLKTAETAALFMTASSALAFWSWRQRDDA